MCLRTPPTRGLLWSFLYIKKPPHLFPRLLEEIIFLLVLLQTPPTFLGTDRVDKEALVKMVMSHNILYFFEKVQKPLPHRKYNTYLE